MKYALVCNDTRGGIQPYVALGLGLRRAGHDAWLVAPEGYRGLAAAAGLPFAGLAGDTQAAMRSPEVQAAIEKGFLATHKLMVRMAGPMMCKLRSRSAAPAG